MLISTKQKSINYRILPMSAYNIARLRDLSPSPERSPNKASQNRQHFKEELWNESLSQQKMQKKIVILFVSDIDENEIIWSERSIYEPRKAPVIQAQASWGSNLF